VAAVRQPRHPTQPLRRTEGCTATHASGARVAIERGARIGRAARVATTVTSNRTSGARPEISSSNAVTHARVAARATPEAGAGARAKEPVHVVFSIDTMSVGGTEMNAVRTAERLDRSRFRLTVVTLRGEGPLAQRYERAGIPVVRFPIYGLGSPATFGQARRLAAYLRRENVSVVHCHDQYSNIFSTLSARLAGVPVIVASKRWLHWPLSYRIANAIGFRAATRVIANSPRVAHSLRARDYVDAKRIVVIPNFVDDAAFSPPGQSVIAQWRGELDLPAGCAVVGVIASLQAIKDHATLIRAVARLAPSRPTLRLVVVGEGALLEELRALASRLGIASAVRFAGLRPQHPSLHYLFDISALSSTSEGFPNALVEAMAAGRPIVATDVGGVADAVRHGENGLLVPPRDPEAFAAAIATLLDDPARASAMGLAGACRAREEYAAPVVVGALEQLYEGLLSAHRSSPG
jgi:glycosyltransferase involved in cell wall biosynthesis